MKQFSKSLRQMKRVYLVCSLAMTACMLFSEKSLQNFVDAEQFNADGFVILFASFFCLFALKYCKTYLQGRIDKEGTLEGQRFFFHHALSRLSDIEEGDLLYNLTEDIYKMMPWYTSGKLDLVLESGSLICMIILMISVDIPLAIAALFLLLISLLISNVLSTRVAGAKSQQQLLNSRLNQFMVNAGRNINSITQLNKTTYFEEKIDRFIESNYIPVLNKTIITQAIYIIQLIFSSEIIPFIILFLGIILSVYGSTTIGSAIIIMDLTVKLSSSVQSIGECISQYHYSVSLYNRVSTLIDPNPVSSVNSPPKERREQMQDFQNLRINISEFSLNQNTVLEKLNIEIVKGDVVLIKGESGKGKSTLAKIVAQRIALSDRAGQILYNGQNINQITASEYHKKVILVDQDVLLFSGSILENIAMELEVSPDDLSEVIMACALSKYIEEYGFDYLISSRGENISGGERQRIGIARALLRRPNLLILDEVTSALNADIAEKVVAGIMKYAKNHSITVIAICHGNEFDSYSTKTILL